MESGYGYVSEISDRYGLRRQYIESFALSALGFLIPVLFGHPQILVGVLVNAFIVRAAMSLPLKRALPVVFTPVLGAIARGLLFGPLTVYLVLMAPFIWAGNLILLWAFSGRRMQDSGFVLRLGASSIAKAGLIYSGAFILFNAGLVPAALLPAMGVLQLSTALAGGLVAYGSLKARLFA
jgi:hypothetical protein